MKSKNIWNRIGQRGVLFQGDVLECGILIKKNTSGLGKRWIAEQYKNGELVASYPADHLYDIDLSFFFE